MSRIASGISIHRSWLTSCLMSSIGKSGARSAGPIGWPVPGWRGGGSGVLKSAWMLYHFVGMSFSSRRNFVAFLSLDRVAIGGLLRIVMRRDLVKSALTIRNGSRPCQYRGLRGILALDAATTRRAFPQIHSALEFSGKEISGKPGRAAH